LVGKKEKRQTKRGKTNKCKKKKRGGGGGWGLPGPTKRASPKNVRPEVEGDLNLTNHDSSGGNNWRHGGRGRKRHGVHMGPEKKRQKSKSLGHVEIQRRPSRTR